MIIEDITDEYKCCCSCIHDIRKHNKDKTVTNYCDIDGHYIGYVACFESVCKEWEDSERSKNVKTCNSL